jgi:hypothetical protein
MMDNASALPTCAQQQQQRKLLLIKIAHLHQFSPSCRSPVARWHIDRHGPMLPPKRD